MLGDNPALPSEADRLVERTLHECMRSDAKILIESTLQSISYDPLAPDTGRAAHRGSQDVDTPEKTKSAIKREKEAAKRARQAQSKEDEVNKLKKDLKAKGKGKGKGKKGGQPSKKEGRPLPDPSARCRIGSSTP